MRHNQRAAQPNDHNRGALSQCVASTALDPSAARLARGGGAWRHQEDRYRGCTLILSQSGTEKREWAAPRRSRHSRIVRIQPPPRSVNRAQLQAALETSWHSTRTTVCAFAEAVRGVAVLWYGSQRGVPRLVVARLEELNGPRSRAHQPAGIGRCWNPRCCTAVVVAAVLWCCCCTRRRLLHVCVT